MKFFFQLFPLFDSQLILGMVFEGELDSACTETRSSYTESELENIKAKNLEVNRNLNFVPVSQSPSLTAFIENQLSKSENFSE